MKCRTRRKQMSAYLDRELGAAARERLAAHLRDCRGVPGGVRRAGAGARPVCAGRALRAPPAFSWRVAAAGSVRASAERRPLPGRDVGWPRRPSRSTAVVAIGVLSGKLLAGAAGAAAGADPAAMFSLDIFAAAPPDSPGRRLPGADGGRP